MGSKNSIGVRKKSPLEISPRFSPENLNIFSQRWEWNLEKLGVLTSFAVWGEHFIRGNLKARQRAKFLQLVEGK